MFQRYISYTLVESIFSTLQSRSKMRRTHSSTAVTKHQSRLPFLQQGHSLSHNSANTKKQVWLLHNDVGNKTKSHAGAGKPTMTYKTTSSSFLSFDTRSSYCVRQLGFLQSSQFGRRKSFVRMAVCRVLSTTGPRSLVQLPLSYIIQHGQQCP
jgi:hypothetical protein